MLLNLHVQNLALIENIDISFEDHLNILTGETGAGKSILIGSIALALGERVNKELVRADAPYGQVELLFSVERPEIRAALADMDIILSEDGELLISRKIMDNRVVNRINDQTVTGAKLREVSELLLDLHAQHEQQSLRQKGYQMGVLDRYGQERIAEAGGRVREAYTAYKEAKAALSEDAMSEQEQKRTMDLLRYELQEIKGANLVPGEDESLAATYKRMKNGKEIIGSMQTVYEICGYDRDESAGSLIGRALASLENAAGLDDSLADLLSQITDIDALMSDFNREMADYIDSLQFDEQGFHEVTERLDVINGLKVKYGNSIADILAYGEKTEQKYRRLQDYEAHLAGLKETLALAEQEYLKQAKLLHALRTEYAGRLADSISEALKDLNFLDVDFRIAVEETEEYTAQGMDAVQFLISTNVGEPIRPLADVASGGELSRIMLAVKSVLADADEIETLIFDEIDVGISGRTAQKVSEKLQALARTHQIICITHLPQIAAMADSHYVIMKQVRDNKTVTEITRLSGQASVEEIARLLGGAAITDTVLSNAKEMKDLAVQTKLY